MLSYRVTLDIPLQLALFVSRLPAEHRREIGTRDGTRALTCWKQAVFALAWFRDRPDIRRLGQGSGISQATAYRYKDEAIEVLVAKAPALREALDKAVEQGLPYLILDGTLISSDRCAGTKTSKKGREINRWYSGKAHHSAGNVQALSAPGSIPLWVSGRRRSQLVNVGPRRGPALSFRRNDERDDEDVRSPAKVRGRRHRPGGLCPVLRLGAGWALVGQVAGGSRAAVRVRASQRW